MKEETAETKMRESLLKFAEGVKQFERKHGLSDSMEYSEVQFWLEYYAALNDCTPIERLEQIERDKKRNGTRFTDKG